MTLAIKNIIFNNLCFEIDSIGGTSKTSRTNPKCVALLRGGNGSNNNPNNDDEDNNLNKLIKKIFHKKSNKKHLENKENKKTL